MTDRVALVTAGAAGIGLAIARQLRAAGWKVHTCDADAAALRRVLDSDSGISGTQADVSDPEAVERVFSDLHLAHGRLDALINNAGISGPVARVEDILPADWVRTVDVDLNGVFFVTRLAVPMLRAAGGGSIINIASSASHFGFPLRSPYTACKWALIGLTKTWAMELGAAGIRVNAISPGSVSGARIDSVIERDARERGCTVEEIRQRWTSQTSMRCFVDTEDVAAAVAFLISPEARYISGQALGVDGHTESLSSPLD